MTDSELLKVLIEFFKDSFTEDPMGVGDWAAQGDQTIDELWSEIVARSGEPPDA